MNDDESKFARLLPLGVRRRLGTTTWDGFVAFGATEAGRPWWDRWQRRRINRLPGEESRLARRISDDPCRLQSFESSRYSQNGEDGIISEIFRRIGSKSRFFVEIAAADGSENCTRALAEDGWGGLWVEADPELASAAQRLVEDRPVKVVEAFVDRASVVGLLGDAGIPEDVDLMVVDIDGNDYWLWEAISSHYQARVVVIEYNASVGPWLDWVLPYDAGRRWDETARHGASLRALAELGRHLGYVLIGCDSNGVNAFFVRKEESAHFSADTIRGQWVPPRYKLPYGHPWHRPPSFASPAVPESEAALVLLDVVAPTSGVARAGGRLYGSARITNRTSVVIGESGDHPLRLTWSWLGADGIRRPEEPERCVQAWRAEPGETAELLLVARAPSVPGEYTLLVGLVQELVRWFDEPRCSHPIVTYSVG